MSTKNRTGPPPRKKGEHPMTIKKDRSVILKGFNQRIVELINRIGLALGGEKLSTVKKFIKCLKLIDHDDDMAFPYLSPYGTESPKDSLDFCVYAALGGLIKMYIALARITHTPDFKDEFDDGCHKLEQAIKQYSDIFNKPLDAMRIVKGVKGFVIT